MARHEFAAFSHGVGLRCAADATVRSDGIREMAPLRCARARWRCAMVRAQIAGLSCA
eukprot:CAMPEP_0176191726 /NCGR_PEP_ID=MMETSP0121_2-20121125/4605_1 /TAXON_ID=160619 /ORGANISM="Kryptoperidinium foliaceum, Strain CCMP 1326" /LENGTH=56 /DNA_ID=CAMNT_0017530393 /DNA_START=107 /DNA_END=273 /DNA_ORIENTATION=-